MKRIFLETHNLKNAFTGFGQFNLHLLRGLKNCDDPALKFVVHSKDIVSLKNEFGDFFEYKYYLSLRRYDWAQIRSRYDLWHSVNQSTKIEPKRDLPYVLTVHDVNFIAEISSNLEHPCNIAFKKKLARANAITYISEFAKASTHQHFNVPDVPETVILNGNPSQEAINLDGYFPKNYPKGKYLFTIGEFWERKNFHLLVEMLEHLPEYSLIIAGNNEREYGQKVKRTISDLGLGDRVMLAGRISEKDKQYYLQNSDAFLFPSLREGFGLPPIEAMRFGTPIFLAHRTSLPEVGGDVAYYWHDLEPKKMAEVFLQGMDSYYNDHLINTKKLVERAASFDWNKAAKEYIKVYKSVL